MKHLFIDTNIWLSLYYFTNDDLTKFEKLKDYLNTSICLYFTEQVKEEIFRNREAKIKEALKSFDMKPLQYPSFSKGFDIYEEFSSNYQNVLNTFKKWRKDIDECILNNTLPADNTIITILEHVTCISCDDYVDKAYRRYKKGNPPGKDNKYGDAINWECLLDLVPNGEDLFFISADKDYISLLEKDKMNPFLLREWKEKKGANIYFYTSLTGFLHDNIQEIELEVETEKQNLITQLSNSCSFITTHGIIAMLRKYTGWTEAQVEEICDAAENNTQVNWILDDEDIREFYYNILSGVNYNSLSKSATKRIIDLYCEKQLLKRQEAQYDYEADAADTL